MFTTEQNNTHNYIIAKKRVDELKKFYKHLAVYIITNVFISGVKIRRNMANGESFEDAFYDFDTFAVWVFWGIAIAIHIFKLFGLPFFLGKNWEQRALKRYINEK